MLILLSPAKSLNTSPVADWVKPTSPRFSAHTKDLLAVMKTKSPDDLRGLMDISDDLAELNYRRYQRFTRQEVLPAAMIFDGDVYDGLKARELNQTDLIWMQDHVRILSGLYGVLRPLDQMRPYRLEMGTSLPTDKGKSLYAYWGDDIANALLKDARAVKADTILNLASQEYAKAALTKAMKLTVINTRFLDEKDGKARIVSFFAKRARGLMARYVIDNRIEDIEQVKAFDTDGYRFQADQSTPAEWVFSRHQPPLKS
ncbi:peroxide stress protein YaaA [Asticcacaulis endophyticus]|nr:peroxide stress protein YaaA [Asticcacaulis endophyticus]